MERFKTLRKVIWLAVILMFLQLVILVAVLFPLTTVMWMSVGILAVLTLYLGRISLALLAELEKKERDGGGK